MKKTLLALMPLALCLVGCQGDSNSDLPKDQDKQLRNNLSRELTPEEVAKMGGGSAGGGTSTAGAPVAPPPGKGPR